MNEKLDIYPNKKYVFRKQLKKLNDSDLKDRDKELIKQFQEYYFSIGTKEMRIAKLTSQLRTICDWLASELAIDKDLSSLGKSDAMRLVAYINRLVGKSEATKADYRRALKQFYAWYKEEDPRKHGGSEEERIEIHKFYHYLEKDVKIAYKIKQADPNTVLNDDEIMRVLDYGCQTVREKAFIITLHELGCRASEYLNLRIGNLHFKDSYMEVDVPDGKTGQRVVYATRSVPFLLKYLDVHPEQLNNNAFLWISDANFNHGQPLLHNGGQRLINRCFEQAGIKKKHNFHWFRHSRATLLAPKLTEALLCKYMGWAIGSRQVKVYLHLCNKQLEDVFLKMNGLEIGPEADQKPIKCVCGTLNHPKEKYCQRCYRPLDVSHVIHQEELKDQRFVHDTAKLLNMASNIDPNMMKTLVQLAKNPEIMGMLEDIKGG